jgi:membrane protease YdiL (CAAX protease family)
MPFWLSLVLFAIPAVLMIASMYVGIPLLESLGLEPLVSFLVAFMIPMAWMFTAALVGYHKVEGRPLSWTMFAERMRFPRFHLKDLMWGIGVFALGMASLVLLTPVALSMIERGWVPLPENIPLLLDPHAVISGATLDQIAGGTLLGRWDIVVLYLVYLFFNIAGEELWWRGYILPRQELQHGRWTWVVHGLLWASFHAFRWWSIITIIPLSLGIAFSAQRLKTNWPAAIAHLLGNLAFFLLVLLGVLGLF